MGWVDDVGETIMGNINVEEKELEENEILKKVYDVGIPCQYNFDG